MRKQVCFSLTLLFATTLFATTLFAQKNVDVDKGSIVKGGQLIKAAQKAIGVEKIDLNSFGLKMSFVSGGNFGEVSVETNVILPNKIRQTSKSKQHADITVTSIWNDTKYKKIAEAEMLGERRITDITNSSLSESSKILDGKIGKDNLGKLKNLEKKDPKVDFINRMWESLFPLILNNPFENNLEFKFVGKAEASNKVANVVDCKSANGRTYRLLFDTETNFLLMMIESYKAKDFSGEEGEYEIKFYFSNRETVNNVSIPRKVKVESKFIASGKSPKISYENIDVLQFKLNPDFKKDIFDLK